jgi:hypothetical protein
LSKNVTEVICLSFYVTEVSSNTIAKKFLSQNVTEVSSNTIAKGLSQNVTEVKSNTIAKKFVTKCYQSE